MPSRTTCRESSKPSRAAASPGFAAYVNGQVVKSVMTVGCAPEGSIRFVTKVGFAALLRRRQIVEIVYEPYCESGPPPPPRGR
ncbi:MAG TPA: hypothetical protein VFZ68_05290 [Acidimicrobiales bacterium]